MKTYIDQKCKLRGFFYFSFLSCITFADDTHQKKRYCNIFVETVLNCVCLAFKTFKMGMTHSAKRCFKSMLLRKYWKIIHYRKRIKRLLFDRQLSFCFVQEIARCMLSAMPQHAWPSVVQKKTYGLGYDCYMYENILGLVCFTMWCECRSVCKYSKWIGPQHLISAVLCRQLPLAFGNLSFSTSVFGFFRFPIYSFFKFMIICFHFMTRLFKQCLWALKWLCSINDVLFLSADASERNF